MLHHFFSLFDNFTFVLFLGPLHNHINSLLLCHLRTTGANCFGLDVHHCGLPQLILSFKWDDPFICYQLLFHTVKYNSCVEPVYGRDLICCYKRKFHNGCYWKCHFLCLACLRKCCCICKSCSPLKILYTRVSFHLYYIILVFTLWINIMDI